MSPSDLPDTSEMSFPGSGADPGLSGIVKVPDLDVLNGRQNDIISFIKYFFKNVKITLLVTSATILGDFLHFGQLFKAFGNNKFVQISYILRQFL